MDALSGVSPNWIVAFVAICIGGLGGALVAWHLRGLAERVATLERKNTAQASALLEAARQGGRNSRLLVIALKDALDYLAQNNAAGAREVVHHVAPHLSKDQS